MYNIYLERGDFMASFVIHDIAGEQFLNTIQNRLGISLSQAEINKFLMGNLIPDSSRVNFTIPENLSKEELKALKWQRSQAIQEEKTATHFRSPEEYDLTIQAPKLDKFIEKYNSLFSKDISVLGYFFHLYTDVLFFGDLFEKTFTCLDEFGNPTIYNSKTKSMELKKDKKRYPVTDIFSHDSEVSIYQDYTKMNASVLNQFQTVFDYEGLLASANTFINPGIEEVDYENIVSVLGKTAAFIKESYELQETTLKVFDEFIVSKFIPEVVESFIATYGELISKSLPVKSVQILKKETN